MPEESQGEDERVTGRSRAARTTARLTARLTARRTARRTAVLTP